MRLVEVRTLHKSYFLEGERIDVLRGVDLDIEAGEMLSLVGPSGAGKSTFLHVVGTLDTPTAGTVKLDAEDVFAKSEGELAEYRSRTIGFVFQSHHLLPEFTALENVMMPAMIQRVPRGEAEGRARELLDVVDLKDRLQHRPGELSGGEQQRVALARALVMRPRLLLADEPTGNLDAQTGAGIHELLRRLNQQFGIAELIVTHNIELARSMPRRLRLEAGRITETI
jgi:lipoprotein-releasing system ATP-binding protein